MQPELRNRLKLFVLELAVYAVLVVGYSFLVLKLLADWLNGLFSGDRKLYAFLSLVFIIVQGVLLEAITRLLVGGLKRHREDR